MPDILRRLFGNRPPDRRPEASGGIAKKRIEKLEEPLIPRGFKVVERYSIYEPFVHAVIVQNPETGETRYVVDELKLTRREKFIYSRVVETLQWELKPLTEVEDPYGYFKKMAARVIHKYRLRLGRLPGVSWSKILYYVERNLLGYGPIDPLMRDPNLEDISCDGVGKPIYVWHRRYESIPTNIVFRNHRDLDDFIIRLAHKAGKHISIAWPILDAMLPEMHRLAATFSREVSTSGSTFTIRKFREDPITIIDMINFKTLDAGTAAYLWVAMEYKMPAMIMGVTGSGKTTLLNSLTCMFRPTIKVVSIEDTPELRLPLDNWVQLVSRPSYGMGPEKVGEVTLFDLVKVSLRYRPDIIIVGEVRGEEAYVLFQALATGHGGVCLPGEQLVLAEVDGKIDLYEVEDIVEGALRGRYREVKVYTIEDGKPVWRDVPRVVIKGGSQRFVRIYAEGSVVHEVHEDHKVVVYRDGRLEAKKARELRKGDLLVSIPTPPVKPELMYLDVLELLKEKYAGKIHVKGADPALRSVPRASFKAVGAASDPIDNRKYGGVAVPLKIVEAPGLARNPETRDVLRVEYGGKARGSVPAKLPLNEDLGFMIGFFLADGSMMYDRRDKLPRKLFFALGRSEKDEKLAEKLVAALKRLGIDANAVHVKKPRGYHQVHVESKIFAITLYELLGGRVKKRDRAVPLDLALRAPEGFRRGIVKGFWLGGGSAFIDGKGRLRMYASTSNRKLAESLVLLMKTLGIHASLKPVDNSRGFGRKTSTVYMVTVLGGQSKKSMAEMLGVTPPRRSYTRVKRRGSLVLHKVVRTEVVEKESLLYDLEVPGLHVYAISGGLVLTHNTTIHAESVDAAVKRLTSPPMNIPEGYIPLMKLGIIVKRVRIFSPEYPAGRIARRVSGIYEIKDVGRYEPVVQWNPFKDVFDKKFRDSMVLREISESIGKTYDELIEEMSRRSVVLQWMAWRGIRDYREVARVIQAYYANPEKVFKHAEEELAQRPGF